MRCRRQKFVHVLAEKYLGAKKDGGIIQVQGSEEETIKYIGLSSLGTNGWIPWTFAVGARIYPNR